MRNAIFKTCLSCIPAATVIISFLLFSSVKQVDHKSHAAATVCCTGYCLDKNQLKQFMLDSLRGNQFEGGIYARRDLLAQISTIKGDSIYLLNVLADCNGSQKVELAMTSKMHSGYQLLGSNGLGCHGCPFNACCSATLSVTRISRDCVQYKHLKP